MGHSSAHISELAYQAVRRAILPQLPRPRDTNGRFISRRELTTKRMAHVTGWTNSRAKKLYYGEEDTLTDSEATELEALVAKIKAKKAGMK